MIKPLTLLAVLGVTAASPLLCQDLVVITPTAAHVEFEDARVRVVRLKLAPQEKLALHDRPNRVVIPLTPNDCTTTGVDGKAHEVKAAAGVAAWSGPGKRTVENHAAPLENIVVELKNAAEPAQPLPSEPISRPAEYLQEKFHHWQFENQYVRVYDVRIPPGETTEFHTHGFDTVVVQVSPGYVQQQLIGEGWKQPETHPPGEVMFTADSKHVRIHRVRNLGKQDFHVILVQLLK